MWDLLLTCVLHIHRISVNGSKIKFWLILRTHNMRYPSWLMVVMECSWVVKWMVTDVNDGWWFRVRCLRLGRYALKRKTSLFTVFVLIAWAKQRVYTHWAKPLLLYLFWSRILFSILKYCVLMLSQTMRKFGCLLRVHRMHLWKWRYKHKLFKNSSVLLTNYSEFSLVCLCGRGYQV